jgi:DNA uptake protein ComE-like DNA-binding protein
MKHLPITLFFFVLSLPFFSSADPIVCGVPPKASELVVESITVKPAGKESAQANAAKERPEKKLSAIDREVAGLTPQERNSLLSLLNNGSLKELMAIDGIAETRANTILSSRPIFELEDLVLLRGFGPGLISKVLRHKEEAVQ